MSYCYNNLACAYVSVQLHVRGNIVVRIKKFILHKREGGDIDGNDA